MKPEDITAWALDELTLEERAQIEAALAATPGTQQQAQSTKAFCALLSEHLADDEAALTAEQRNALKALQHPQARVENVVPFTADAAPARMNGKAFYAKVTASQERKEPKNSPWTRIAALAACLMFIMVAIDQVRKIPGSQVAMVEQKGPAASHHVIVSSVKPSAAEGKLMTLSAPAAPPEPLLKDGIAMATGPNSPYGLDKLKASALPAEPLARAKKASADASASTLDLNGSNTYTGGVTMNTAPSDKAQANPAAPAATASAPAESVIHRASPAVPLLVTKTERGSAPPVDEGRIDRSSIIGGSRPLPAQEGELYAKVVENPFATVQNQPLSTFSIDVDTASYANVRRFLNEGRLPPPDAVRLEELINYFPYAYEQPDKDQPFSVQVDMAEAPWAPQHRLARISIKGRDVGQERQAANFVFLVDVSGSMHSPERLPLVKQGLQMLAEQLQEDDRVSIVTYAGECSLALESTSGKDKNRIMDVIRSLHTGGSTNGESGIRMAYEQADANFIKEGINRVILCTDGDFNVGISDPEQLEKLIKEKAKGGTFLSVLGYGTGNLQDRTMEKLADNGNGNYAYIDSLGEARKVLVEQMHGTLITIAKDVKIQVEFNPATVASYRLIGYEKRLLAAQDFNNDKKDAGEIGAGHTITALYEVVPVGVIEPNGALASIDDLKYQPKKPVQAKTPPNLGVRPPQEKLEGFNDETMTVKLRYKAPDGQLSKLIEMPVRDTHKTLKDSPGDFRFATAVAGFGMLLRGSEHVEDFSYEAVRKLALSGKGDDALGYRGEFIQLIDKAKGLQGTR